MKSNADGRIRNKQLFMQRISFDGLGGQTLYPTDIDLIYEHKNRGYFMAELKCKGSALPTGQRLLMERFARDMQRAGKFAIIVIAEHECNDDIIPLAECQVSRVYITDWQVVKATCTVRQAFQMFLDKVGG